MLDRASTRVSLALRRKITRLQSFHSSLLEVVQKSMNTVHNMGSEEGLFIPEWFSFILPDVWKAVNGIEPILATWLLLGLRPHRTHLCSWIALTLQDSSLSLS
ncbi:hypothetical protein TNCV_3965531 [Trichonephila clavipes]|nr:hypothetical protein TNCV_3965531 [Trichonephila clavipes]